VNTPYRKVIGTVVVAGALLAVGIYYGLGVGGDGGAPGAAQLWIDTDGGTCARDADGAAYDDSTACDSLQEAYNEAELGDLVLIRNGTYGEQEWASASGSKGQPDAVLSPVTFRAENEHQVTLGSVKFRVPHVRLEDVIANGVQARYRVEDTSFEASGNAHFDNLILTAGVMFAAVKNFSLTNTEISGYPADGVDVYATGSGASDMGHYPSDGLIEGNYIHDLNLVDDDHIDGIQFNAGHDIVIRNNRIDNIHHQGMLLQSDKGPVYNLTIENNWIGDLTDPGFSLMFERRSGRRCDGHIVRYNSFSAHTPVGRAGPGDQCRGVVYGNVWPAMSSTNCNNWTESFRLRYNVFEGGSACGRGSYVISSPSKLYVNESGFDLHLTSTTEARAKGSPASCPSVDIDGDARPQPAATRCDAGADERE
jgi:Right handed beta helix region